MTTATATAAWTNWPLTDPIGPAHTTVLLGDMGFSVECSRCITPRDCEPIYHGKFHAKAAADRHARLCRPHAPDLDNATVVQLASSHPATNHGDQWARAYAHMCHTAATITGQPVRGAGPWHRHGTHPRHGGPLVWAATAITTDGTPIIVALIDDLEN